jgi:hypothetical protein
MAAAPDGPLSSRISRTMEHGRRIGDHRLCLGRAGDGNHPRALGANVLASSAASPAVLNPV